MSTELVPVFTGEIAGSPVQLVDARLLHAFLEIGKRFASWIVERIEEYGFVQDQDFLISQNREIKIGRGGDRKSVDYHLTLDMAKELAMVERNDQGRQARRYFIECERRLFTGVPYSLRELPTTITPSEQQTLHELVGYRCTPYGAEQKKVRGEVWSRVYRKFRVAKYDQLQREQLSDVIAYIMAMELRTKRPALIDLPATGESRILTTLNNGQQTAVEVVPPDAIVIRQTELQRYLLDAGKIAVSAQLMRSIVMRLSGLIIRSADIEKLLTAIAADTGCDWVGPLT